MRQFRYPAGVGLIAVAVAAVPSGAVAESYAGGSAVRGWVEDGRYFVDPGHGRPVAEVSGATWRAVYWLERLWPLSVLVPGLAGLLLTGGGAGPNRSPPPIPSAEPPPGVLWACLAAGGGVVAGTWLCWVLTRTPWVVMVVAWALACAGGATCAWLYARALARPAAGPDSDRTPS